MSTTNPLTHFSTKFNPLPYYPHFSLRTSKTKRLMLSRDSLSCNNLFGGRKIGLMSDNRVIKVPILGLRSGDNEDNNVTVLEQEGLIDESSQLRSVNFEATLNRLSKWLVAALFGVVVLYRHDAEALCAGMGSIINAGLSVVLKRILKQERPVSNLRSDPGMPSSHAQSIFYGVVFIIISMVEWLGVNELTVIFGSTCLVFGSYLSWLRVTQELHTTSQVAVGAVLGSCFSLLWLWSWQAIVLDAFNSFLWVRILILLGSAILGLGFLSYVIRNWFSDER